MPDFDTDPAAIVQRPDFLHRIAGQTIRLKIALLTCVVAAFVALMLFWYANRQAAQITTEASYARLDWEARSVADPLRTALEQYASDARLVANSSIPEGYVRARDGGGMDPVTGNDLAHWRARFELAFRAVMQMRPFFMQMSFIPRAPGGQEFARVDRSTQGRLDEKDPDRQKDKLRAIPRDLLSAHPDTPYVAAGFTLGEGELSLSEFAAAPADGPDQRAHRRWLRLVVPVRHDGETIGLISEEIDYFALLEHTLETVHPAVDLIVRGASGDAYAYAHESRNFAPATATQLALLGDATVQAALQRTDGAAFEAGEMLGHVTQIALPTRDGAFRIALLSYSPRAVELTPLTALRERTVLLGVLLVGSSVLLAFLISQSFTEPLQKMTAELREASRTGVLLYNLPTARHDEIGDLARSFEALTLRIATSEARAQAVIKTVVDGIITIDESGTIRDFNPACEQLFGYSRDEVVGRNIGMLMPSSDAAQHDAYLTRFQQSKGDSKVVGKGRDLIGLRKDGSTFFMELSVSRTNIGRSRYFTGILRDVTARKEMEIMKNEFVSTVNHELRTPLTTIRGALGLLKATSAHLLDAKSKRLLELSYDGCGRLAHLVNDILDMEKIEAGKMDYRLERLEISELVQEIVERHTSYAHLHNVRFVVHPAPVPLHAIVDPSRFNQAVVNLLSNAAKFSPPGSEVTFTVNAEDGDRVTLRVTDHGPGIPREFRDKIFGKFAQADSSNTRSQGGSGLGLNIAKSIIVAFGGDITFTTQLGRGTTFCISLPLAEETTLKRSA